MKMPEQNELDSSSFAIGKEKSEVQFNLLNFTLDEITEKVIREIYTFFYEQRNFLFVLAIIFPKSSSCYCFKLFMVGCGKYVLSSSNSSIWVNFDFSKIYYPFQFIINPSPHTHRTIFDFL